MRIDARCIWRYALFASALLAFSATAPRAQGLYDAFVQAVVTDRSDEVRALLARGIDPNAVDPRGEPVLLVAARAGWQPTVDALLAAGAKVDARNPFGDRAIMVAALGGHLAIVKTLLRRGAALDTPGWTPLIYAATNGQTEVARYLLDVGADINAAAPNGTTALMMAVRGGHGATVDLLLARGGDVNRRNPNGATALGWATPAGIQGIRQVLAARAARY